MSIEEQERLARERIANLTEKQNEEINKDYYYTEEEKREIKKEKQRQELEASKQELFKFLDKNPEIAQEIVDRYTKKEIKEANKRNAKYKKYLPVFVSAALLGGYFLGGFAGKKTIKNENLVIGTSYENLYSSIDEAPMEVKKVYLEDEFDKYASEVANGSIIKNEKLETAFSSFERNYSTGNIEAAKEDAKNFNNFTMSDGTDKTMPLNHTNYAGATVNENGEVLIPITSLLQLDSGDELVYDGSNLKKKTR